MIDYGKRVTGVKRVERSPSFLSLGLCHPNIRPYETGSFDKLLIKRLIESIASCHLVNDVCRVKSYHYILKFHKKPISSTALGRAKNIL